MTTNQISVSKRRRLLIRLFYRYLLLDSDNNVIKQDLLDETQGTFDELTLKHATVITDKMPIIIKDIQTHLDHDWPWSRLPFLVQAILIVGVYEIGETETPKAVTINEMTQITKEYGLTNHYRFVNALLDKINKS